MKLDINEKNKTIMIWCNNKDKPITNIPLNIQNEINRYKQKKYKVCIIQSGKEDIKNNFLQLMKNNIN